MTYVATHEPMDAFFFGVRWAISITFALGSGEPGAVRLWKKWWLIAASFRGSCFSSGAPCFVGQKQSFSSGDTPLCTLGLAAFCC